MYGRRNEDIRREMQIFWLEERILYQIIVANGS
jgi:hypothetical protein